MLLCVFSQARNKETNKLAAIKIVKMEAGKFGSLLVGHYVLTCVWCGCK